MFTAISLRIVRVTKVIGVVSIALIFNSVTSDARAATTLPGDAVLFAGERSHSLSAGIRALDRSSDVQLTAGLTDLQLAAALPSTARGHVSAAWETAIEASANKGGDAATGLDAGTTVLGLLIGGLGLLLLRAWRAKQ